jgi:hypothetical protein
MIDPEKSAKLDQAIAECGETMPLIWRTLYLNCVVAGFSESQALDLVKAYIISMGTNGTKP